MSSAEAFPASGAERFPDWVFPNKESVENRFGMEMERIQQLVETDEGKEELLHQMKEQDPSLNGNVHGALEQVEQNLDTLKKKESFMQKMLNMPKRALEATGRTIKKHPVATTAVAIVALLALLYFTPSLGTTAGEYGNSLIQSFKGTLSKLGVAIPSTPVEASAAVPVTDAAVGTEAAELANQAFASPGEAMIQNLEAAEAVEAATGLDPAAALPELSQTAAEVMQSPEAVEALESAAAQGIDPSSFEGILSNLPE